MSPVKFYHVSLELDYIISLFEPRVPVSIMEHEDEVTPRICISSSIDGCLSAVPWGGANLWEYMEMNLYEECEDENIYVRVYEFEIDANNSYLISPEKLWESDLVRDAICNREYWYIGELIPNDTYVIAISDWHTDTQDVLSYEDELAIQSGADYEDVWSGGVVTTVSNVKYNIVG